MSPPRPRELTQHERDELAAAEARGLPFLTYRDRDDVLRAFLLPESGDAVTIGRGAWMDLPLTWDQEVSRVHARLERIGDDWTVVDEGLSRNGTFLNGERVAGRRRASDGDEIRCGRTAITIRVPGQPADAGTVVADRS